MKHEKLYLKQLLFLRRNREFLNMSSINKAIGCKDSKMSLILNDRPNYKGYKKKLNEEQIVKLNEVLKTLKP